MFLFLVSFQVPGESVKNVGCLPRVCQFLLMELLCNFVSSKFIDRTKANLDIKIFLVNIGSFVP